MRRLLSKLNRYVLREKYQLPTPAEAVADIAQLVKPSILQSWMPQKDTTSVLWHKTAKILPCSSHHLNGLSTYVRHMACHLLQSTTTGEWQRH